MEVNQTLAYLPLLLLHQLGPQAWGWFDKSAAQEYLGTAVYDSAQQKIDDSAADWDFAPQDRVRGEINIEMEGNLSNMIDSMAFENLDDGSLGDNQEMACEVLLDVDFQVNLDGAFHAPKAHECASQESFATGSTATSGTLVPDPAPDPEPIALADDPPGAGRQDNAPRAPSSQISSEV
jgi:hypothetical protein